MASSAICPASSTPVGPAPTTANVSHACLLCGVVVLLGDLERAEDPRAHAARVVERLHPRSDLRPLVVSEVGVRGAGRDDQRVVRDLLDLVGDHPHRALLEVDVVDDAEQHAHVALPAEHRAQRGRDLPRRQDAGRDLVEQRLEQMLVVRSISVISTGSFSSAWTARTPPKPPPTTTTR